MAAPWSCRRSSAEAAVSPPSINRGAAEVLWAKCGSYRVLSADDRTGRLLLRPSVFDAWALTASNNQTLRGCIREGMMRRPSKKHHFVPQAQLRHFAADSERRSIYAAGRALCRPAGEARDGPSDGGALWRTVVRLVSGRPSRSEPEIARRLARCRARLRLPGADRALQNPVEIGVGEGRRAADQEGWREHIDHLLAWFESFA